jgi:hypothetical protein
MATFPTANIQATNEIATYTLDFTQDVPTGGSITAGTATHYPPSGAAGTITCTVSTPYVYVTVPALAVVGVHYVDVLATASDGDKPVVRLTLNAVYPTPTCRSGMVDLVTELRIMSEANPDDYTIAGVPYWSDAQLQTILDNNRTDLIFEPLQSIPWQGSGSIIYREYRTWTNMEKTTGGTDIFYVQDSNGVTIGSANYTVDYLRGVITFTADQGATYYYITGRSYDLNAGAAEVWRKKGAHYAHAFNFSTDNHRIDREQIYTHCKEQAQYFDNISRTSASSIDWDRSDVIC